MDRSDAWNAKVESVKDKYADRINAIMQQIAAALTAAGYVTDGPTFLDGDYYSWVVLVRTASGADKDLSDHDVDVTFQICESPLYDGTEDGITFRLDIVEVGGRILGGMSPYNYTEACWVDLDDEVAIEARFRLFEQAAPADVAGVLDTEIRA